jgi:hypothetical protein
MDSIVSEVVNVLHREKKDVAIAVFSGTTFFNIIFTGQVFDTTISRQNENIYAQGGINPVQINRKQTSYSGTLSMFDGEYSELTTQGKLLFTDSRINSLMDFPSKFSIYSVIFFDKKKIPAPVSAEVYHGCVFNNISRSISADRSNIIVSSSFDYLSYKKLN